MNIQHIDNEALRELQIVMGDDFAKLLRTFASDSAIRIAAIEQTAAAGDGEGLRRAAHSFKGSSGNMGARQLSELCRQIEEFARDGEVERCTALIAQLSDEFALVQREFKRFNH